MHEDHTLGNALRYVIMKKYVQHFGSVKLRASTLTLQSPDVEFCGYSIPHPSDPKMNIRIQTYGKLLHHGTIG